MLTFSFKIIKKKFNNCHSHFFLLFSGSVGSFAPDNFQFKPMHIPNISTPLGENNYELKILKDKKLSIKEHYN